MHNKLRTFFGSFTIQYTQTSRLGEYNKRNFVLVICRVPFGQDWYQISDSVNFANIFDKSPRFSRLKPVVTQNMNFGVLYDN